MFRISVQTFELKKRLMKMRQAYQVKSHVPPREVNAYVAFSFCINM